MKSKLLYNQMINKEKEHKVSFLTFTINDFRSMKLRPITLTKLEPLYKTAIEVSFTRQLNNNKQLNFITIIFAETLAKHPNKTISDMIKTLVGQKIRLYSEIFNNLYFDFEDQCFSNNIIKVTDRIK